MSREIIHHPIQQAIDDIWKAGHTPRVQVDARRPDVVIPEQVKTRWGARLVLDLDAAWPLNLEYGPQGLEVDLAFQGFVSRCALPWAAIYVVLDRATGRGMVIEEHVPKGGAADESGEPPAALRSVGGGSTPKPGAVLQGASSPKPVALRPAGSEPSTTEADPSEAAGDEPAEVREGSDEEAKKRRARFKVIDGGR